MGDTANNDVLAMIVSQYDAAAQTYETDPSHVIQNEDMKLWRDLVAPLVRESGTRVLDVGCGTGVLTRLVAGLGAATTGLEPSGEMIAQARKALDGSGLDIAFRKGDSHDRGLFPAESFDAIVSRQAACYLQDPLTCFSNWRHWLRPGGKLLLIDGLWSRAGWGESALIDQLPLSCLQTTATIPYLLGKSGFAVDSVDLLGEINRRAQAAGAGSSIRYAVHATVPRH